MNTTSTQVISGLRDRESYSGCQVGFCLSLAQCINISMPQSLVSCENVLPTALFEPTDSSPTIIRNDWRVSMKRSIVTDASSKLSFWSEIPIVFLANLPMWMVMVTQTHEETSACLSPMPSLPTHLYLSSQNLWGRVEKCLIIASRYVVIFLESSS